MEKYLSNTYIATKFNTRRVLAADIERGGVFASILGVYTLLPEQLKANVVGVIVNKFRGDMSLFDEGVTIIEEQFKLKVLGVIPYRPFNLGFEDAQSIMNYTQDTSAAIIKVGVVRLPHISNFTDFEPLIADSELILQFVHDPSELEHCDLHIIPDRKHIRLLTCVLLTRKDAHPGILNGIGILKFVHQNMPKAALVMCKHVRIF